MPVPAESHLRHFLRASLGDSSRSIVALLRTATPLLSIRAILIDAVPIPLKSAPVVVLRHGPVDRHVADDTGATSSAPAPHAPLPESGGDSAAMFLGCSGFIKGHTNSQGAGWVSMDVWRAYTVFECEWGGTRLCRGKQANRLVKQDDARPPVGNGCPLEGRRGW